jgi:hypothetical protein
VSGLQKALNYTIRVIVRSILIFLKSWLVDENCPVTAKADYV